MPVARTDGPHSILVRDPLFVHDSALRLLLEAHACAHDLGCDGWEFAVEIDRLHAAGVSNSQLRWLLRKGYIAQGVENTDAAGGPRTFQTIANLSLRPGTCFVLTEAGLALVADPAPRHRAHTAAPLAAATPAWHGNLHELRFGEMLVKRFRQRAPSQELILQAFEEEGWPPSMDDPLPPAPEQDSKRRLRVTISNLNRSQLHGLIHFHGGGDGKTVCWRTSDSPAARDGTAMAQRRHGDGSENQG
jgi:hypothetical protein